MPSELIGRQVRVLLNASDLTVYDIRTPVATHQRLLTKGVPQLDLDQAPAWWRAGDRDSARAEGRA